MRDPGILDPRKVAILAERIKSGSFQYLVGRLDSTLKKILSLVNNWQEDCIGLWKIDIRLHILSIFDQILTDPLLQH